MKTKVLLLICISMLAGYISAQSVVQVKDILVSPVMEIDTITNLPLESNFEKLSVMCKINDVSSAETVHILFGTAEESGDVLSLEADIINENGVYFISLNGEETQISGNILEADIELSQSQTELFSFITMYVTDNQDQESEHLIFTR